LQQVTASLSIALGSALGGVLRYWCSGLVARWFGETFPWGTLIVNIGGSLLIGLFATLTAPDGRLLVGTLTRQFVMLGVLGGFTTFSSFSLQTLALAQSGRGRGYSRLSFHRSLGGVLDGKLWRAACPASDIRVARVSGKPATGIFADRLSPSARRDQHCPRRPAGSCRPVSGRFR
jgi:CrcB protein